MDCRHILQIELFFFKLKIREIITPLQMLMHDFIIRFETPTTASVIPIYIDAVHASRIQICLERVAY